MLLDHPQFQEILKYYWRKKGFPIKISVFDYNSVSLLFAKWVYKLTDTDLEEILKDYIHKLSAPEFMGLISAINKNSEILKYLVYNLFTENSLEYISEITGRSLNIVKSYEERIHNEKVRE